MIIPTRNKPEDFANALNSVSEQSICKDLFEIIVVNDGSDDHHLPQYEVVLSACPSVTTSIFLTKRANGHGPGFARNTGVEAATGEYICFLDDDDIWTDTDYLQSVHDYIQSQSKKIDLVYSNQTAVNQQGVTLAGPIWIEDLAANLALKPDASFHKLSTAQVLTSSGFAHMNCTIINKAFYQTIGAYDETLRYEGDRDLFYRSVDNAQNIVHYTKIVAQHYVPDQTKTNNVSTKVKSLQKRVFQIKQYQSNFLNAKTSAVEDVCRTGLSDILKHTTDELVTSGNYKRASRQAFAALSYKFTIKWCLYACYLKLKALGS